MALPFQGAATRLQDTDLPRIGSKIGVGEDVLHAIIDVEAPKSGFDDLGRPRILFEPHVFYRELGPGAKRDAAVKAGLAYQNWKPGAYGPESGQYGKLDRAIAIDRNAALRSCSWGRGQIMGFNHALAGFASAEAMVSAFMASEAAHIEAMVSFIASKKIDVALRKIQALTRPSTADDWRPVASGYNGSGYEANGYHIKLAQRHNFWRTIPDTPWSPVAPAAPVQPAPATPGTAKPQPAPAAAPAPPITPPVATGPSRPWWASILHNLLGKEP